MKDTGSLFSGTQHCRKIRKVVANLFQKLTLADHVTFNYHQARPFASGECKQETGVLEKG